METREGGALRTPSFCDDGRIPRRGWKREYQTIRDHITKRDDGRIPRRGWKPKNWSFFILTSVTMVVFPVGDGNGVPCGHRIEETEARS